MTSRLHGLLVVAVVGLLAVQNVRAQQSTAPSETPRTPANRSAVPGQQPANPAYPPAAQGPGVPSASSYPPSASQPALGGAMQLQPSLMLDRQMARLLTIGNQEEISLGQLAQKRAQSDAVKNFARQMVQDHSQFVDKLQQVGLPSEARRGVGQPAAPSAQPGAGGERAGVPLSADVRDPALILAQQVGQRRTQLTQQELNRQQGINFDAAYIGQQISAHIGMLAALQEVQNHATGELKQLAGQGVQATEHHLNEARNIMQQLQEQIAATARRPEGNPPK